MEAKTSIVQTSDGAELLVQSLGLKSAQPIVLLHGFSLDHTTWLRVAEHLVDAGYRVIAPDLRGHGQSTLGSEPPTMERFAGDIEAVIYGLELRPVHLVGHSLGAVIALAARVNDHLASSVKTVTSLAGTAQSIQNPVMKVGAQLFSSRAGIWALGQQPIGRLMISTWFGKKPASEDLDWIRTLSAKTTQQTRVVISDTTNAIDLRPTFADPGPATLIMCGRNDKATPLKFSEQIASAVAGAELVVIENAGHMAMIEQPASVATGLTTWIESLA